MKNDSVFLQERYSRHVSRPTIFASVQRVKAVNQTNGVSLGYNIDVNKAKEHVTVVYPHHTVHCLNYNFESQIWNCTRMNESPKCQI